MKKYFKTVIVTSTLLLCGCLVLLASQLPARALTPTTVTLSTATQTTIASDPIGIGTFPSVGTPTVTVVVIPSPIATTTPLPKPSPTVPPAQKPTPQPQPTSIPIQSPTQGAGAPFFPPTVSTPTLQPTPRTTPTPTPSPTPTTVAATATAVSNGVPTASNNQSGTTSSTMGSSLLLPIGVSAAVLLLLALIVGIVLLNRNKAQPRRPFTPRVPLTPTAPATPMPWAFQQQNADMGQQMGMSILPQTPVPFAAPAAFMATSQTSPALNMTPMSPPPPPSFFNPDNATIASLTGPLNSFSGKLPAIPAPQGNTTPPTMPPYLGMGLLGEAYLPSDLRPLTSALPKQPSQQPAGQIQPNPISSDMRPLLPDSFDLTQILGNQTQQATIPAPAKTQPSLPIVPPSIQDDPVLETIMRQAQMGLYAHPVPSDNLNDFQQGNSSKHSNMFLL